MTIVFVHIPKVAGTSLKRAIEEKLGSSQVFCDYHRPMARAEWDRKLRCVLASFKQRGPAHPVIFGHFPAGKYARFNGYTFAKRSGCQYAVYFREPLQRAISHYYFWQRTDVSGHRVWERFAREKWSLERFLLGKEHANFQSQFLWRFPIEQFDFIGLVDHYQESLELLGQRFGILKGLRFMSANANIVNSIDHRYRVEPELEAQFKLINHEDYSLYRRAEEIFSANLTSVDPGALIP